MYLEIVVAGKKSGASSGFIGPFSSGKKREEFKKAWIEVLGGPRAIIVKRSKLPKNETAMTPGDARVLLACCRMIRELH